MSTSPEYEFRHVSPLCLACIGREGGCIHRPRASAPWIPSPEELEQFREDMDIALSFGEDDHDE